MFRTVADIRRTLRDTQLDTQAKVKAITDTLIPLMSSLSTGRRHDAERILRGINRTMTKRDVAKEVDKALTIIIDQLERDGHNLTSNLLNTKATRRNNEALPDW